jgi:transcriptional regulator with XRE-family HTH domain
MANRSSPVHDASQQARWINQVNGRELRLARIMSGRTQQQVAARLGRSRSWVSRAERARFPGLTVADLTKHAAAVGLRVSVRLWPAGRRPLDHPQLALLERLRSRTGALWRWELEVPVPIEKDLRAADARISNAQTSIVVEAITRLVDVQAQLRAAQLKRRDLQAQRLVLLVSATSTNRTAMRAAGPMLRETLPVQTWAALRALAAGRDPGGDALIVL